MNYVIIGLIAIAVFFAVRYIIKSKKSGKGCPGCPGGGCSGCCSSCSFSQTADTNPSSNKQ